MLVGHVAVGLIGKRIDRSPSLGTLLLAALLADLLWCVFMLAGLEQIEIVAGIGAANYLRPIEIGFSHSLASNVLFAGLFAAAYWAARRSALSAWVLLGAVLSHWILDVLSHPPDMPLAPGTAARFGLGLWTSLPATIAVEGGLWCVAILAYVRSNRARAGAAPSDSGP